MQLTFRRGRAIPTNASFPRQGYRGYIVNLSETALKTLRELLSLTQRVLGSSPSASTILHRRKQTFSTAAESYLFDMV